MLGAQDGQRARQAAEVHPALQVKRDLREIWLCAGPCDGRSGDETFAEKYGAKYEKAVTCLTKDRDALLTFYDFPAEHWDHLRTANPIESVFATVRHRTVRTKGALSQDTARLMVFKLVMAAARTWRRLKGENQLPKVDPRCHLQRRHRGHHDVRAERRLIAPSPNFPHSSSAGIRGVRHSRAIGKKGVVPPDGLPVTRLCQRDRQRPITRRILLRWWQVLEVPWRTRERFGAASERPVP